jgi:hypothetical protein
MCDGDSKFMKNNPFQLTYPPEYEIKYTNNQNCQMINAFNILFLKNALQNVKTDINSIGITRKQIQKICPTYFKECEDSSTCKYTSCDEIKDDTIPPYCSDDIQMDSYDWGPDPEVSGETSLEKLFNCIDTKIRDRFNKLSICDLEKLYYTDCKFLVDPLTVNYASLENNDKIPPDIAETLAKMLLIGNIVDLPCTYSSAGYGLKIGDYIKQQLGVSGNFPDIKATQQLQSQCCKSTNA